MLCDFLYKMSNVNDIVNCSSRARRRECKRTIINRSQIKITIYSQSNYGNAMVERDKMEEKHRDIYVERRSRRANEKGLGRASTEFQVDDKTRMTSIQCQKSYLS